MALGQANNAPEVAACYDCHGHHDVLPASNPNSHLSKANILGTCQQCHAGATAKFTEYKPHANPLDGKNYPVQHIVFLAMTALLISVFVFFGGHTLAWLVRAIYLYWHDSKTFREAKISTQEGGEWFTRFLPFERFLHFLVVTSFLLLVITGMPLKFYYTDWARTLFSIIGGAETARALHRLGAIVTFLYFGLHAVSLVRKCWVGRRQIREPATGRFSFKRLWNVLFGPDSMMPTWQDWRDFVAHNKWFFGQGPKPQFDRWTYWEKFDYFAVFWGVAIIGTSGLVMWFPDPLHPFLPGLAHQRRPDHPLRRSPAGRRIHLLDPLLQHPFPDREVPDGHRHLLRPRLQERNAPRTPPLVRPPRRRRPPRRTIRVRDEWLRWKSIARSFGYIFFGLGVHPARD